jgi:hypothetical protein
MNAGTPSEWNDVADLWKSETTSISIEQVQRHARRARLNLLAVVTAELLSCAIGIVTAAWLLHTTTILGLGIGFGITIFTAIVLRWQWSALQRTDEAALKSLETAAHREDQVREFLRVGRAVMLAALIAVVMAASAHLREFTGGSWFELLPLIASGFYLIAVLLFCTHLDRSARRRAAVYRRLGEELGGLNECETSNAIGGTPEQ